MRYGSSAYFTYGEKTMKIHLKGMSWDHDRGYLPLASASEKFNKTHPNISISWEKRSLQAFADRPLDIIAKEYDFMIIDHPHIGEASEKSCIIPFNDQGYDDALLDLSKNSVGPSYESYHLDQQQWALPIDTAAQVACYRPDLINDIPQDWDDVLALAKRKKVLFPLKPVDAVDSFFTLCANLGQPVAAHKEFLVDKETAQQVLDLMLKIAQHIPKECMTYNPIEVLEILSRDDNTYAYCPLLFGYNNYSRKDYRPKRIQFCDIPVLGSDGPKGSIIGGTGIAISSQCTFQEYALEFAFMVSGDDFQRNEYFQHAGQPSHAAAWSDQNINNQSLNFFHNTKETLDKSWLRPRYNGFLYLADIGGDLVNAYLLGEIPQKDVIKKLEQAYQTSLSGHVNYKYE